MGRRLAEGSARVLSLLAALLVVAALIALSLLGGLRWVNIALSAAATWMFVATLLRRWALMEWPERWVSLGFVGVLVSIGYGSAEALHQDVSLGFRVALMTSSLACLCIALTFDAMPHLIRTLRHHPARRDPEGRP